MRKRTRILIYAVAVIGVIIFLPSGCKKGYVINENKPVYGSVTDIEGNTYKTVIIGTQEWMAENLRTKKYNDGKSLIPSVRDSASWSNLTTPGYCWYGNDSVSRLAAYGILYNWYAINTGKLAPIGWHIPTDDDWIILIDYLEQYGLAGGQLKEAGTVNWLSPNTGADNSSGFSALPGGYRSYNGHFDLIGYYGGWWSKTVNDSSTWSRDLSFNVAAAYRHGSLYGYGLSIRCVKD